MMDPNYLVKTLSNAFMKLGPMALYAVAGYFVFIKLPFWLMAKLMKQHRSDPSIWEMGDKKELEAYDAFIQKINVHAKINVDRTKTEQKTSQSKTQERTKSQKPPQNEKPKAPPIKVLPEELIFSLGPGQKVTKGELKKRYHELIKMHHPDKVASLAPEFKKVAEIRTQQINAAYDKLKKKAA